MNQVISLIGMEAMTKAYFEGDFSLIEEFFSSKPSDLFSSFKDALIIEDIQKLNNVLHALSLYKMGLPFAGLLVSEIEEKKKDLADVIHIISMMILNINAINSISKEIEEIKKSVIETKGEIETLNVEIIKYSELIKENPTIKEKINKRIIQIASEIGKWNKMIEMLELKERKRFLSLQSEINSFSKNTISLFVKIMEITK